MSYSASRNYLSATRELIEARKRSQADDRFCANGGKIVYLLDTNICVSFLDTAQKAQRGATGVRGLFSESIANSLDRVMVRFLFEGHLPGQKEPAYMLPPHWGETVSQMSRLASLATVKSRPLDPTILDRLFALRNQPDDLESLIERENLSDFLKDLTSAANYGRRIESLLSNNETDQPRLSTIDRSIYWDVAGEGLRWEDFIFWQARLKAFRGPQNSKSRRANNEQKTIANDAMSLALIQSLYRENEGAIGEASHLRFVFVTADNGLMQVYNDNRDRFEADGIPHFMRAPSDYTPIVNYAYMHERILASGNSDHRSSSLVKEIEEALRLSQPFGANDSPPSYREIRLSFRATRKKWNDIAETLILLGARYFVDDHTSNDVSAIADLFEEDDIIDAANRYLRSTVTAVRNDHTRQMSAAAIDRLLPTLKGKSTIDGRGSMRPRAPFRYLDIDIMMPLRTGRSPLVGPSDSLSELISKIEKADATESTEMAVQIQEALKKAWKNPRYAPSSYLIAAGLYFSAGAWESARLCTDLCRTALRENSSVKKIWKREARYAAALSLRMAMHSDQEFTKANNHLLENLKGAEPSVATFRDTIERSALLLTASVVQMIEQATHYPIFGEVGAAEYMEEDDISEKFDDAVEDASDAAGRLEGYITPSNYRVISGLMGQAESNILGALIFSHMIPDLSAERATVAQISLQEKKLRKLLEDLSLRPRFTAQIYFKCSEVLKKRSESTFREFLSLVSATRTRRSDLSAADRVEQDFMCRWLADSLRIPADDSGIRRHISFRQTRIQSA